MPQKYQDLLVVGEDQALAVTTKRRQKTPIKHWKIYTEEEMGRSSLLTESSIAAYGMFTQEEIEVRTLIILGFVAKMVTGDGKYLRGHETDQTMRTYLTEIDTWHLQQCKQPLIPAIAWKEIMRSMTKITKGLLKLKDVKLNKSEWKRRGLRGKYVKILNDYTRGQMAGEIFIFHGVRVTLTPKLISNIVSLRSFAWQQCCRMGECTTTDLPGWLKGAPFARGKRASRVHVTNLPGRVERVKYGADGRATQFRLPAFEAKINNLYTDLDFVVPVMREASIKLDCGSDLENMLRIDHVEDYANFSEFSSLETTPLWRFPPGCSKKMVNGIDTDPYANRSLNAEFLTILDRAIMRLFPGDFDDLVPLQIAGHSYR